LITKRESDTNIALLYLITINSPEFIASSSIDDDDTYTIDTLLWI